MQTPTRQHTKGRQVKTTQVRLQSKYDMRCKASVACRDERRSGWVCLAPRSTDCMSANQNSILLFLYFYIYIVQKQSHDRKKSSSVHDLSVRTDVRLTFVFE